MAFDGIRLRADFPIFQTWQGEQSLVYLDSAATSQKPRAVIAAVTEYFERWNANVHRSVHTLAEAATERYERARHTVAEFIGADAGEIVFVRNATEALNLVAYSFARPRLRPGDEIVLAISNHHSNIVPWQQVAASTGAVLRMIPLTPELELDLSAAADLINTRTKIVSVTHKSNVLGSVLDVSLLARLARAQGAAVVVDAAQSVPHQPVDVAALDCDFLAFTGHKMLGPMGIGVLYGRRAHLEQMPPFLTGGEMVREVGLESASWNDVPWKFEAGTPNVGGAVGLAAAIEYLARIGLPAIAAHERSLAAATVDRLAQIEGIHCVVPRGGSYGIVSFSVDGVHPHDVATVLDGEAIAVRAGHHCAQPLHEHALKIPATVRVSFYLYNDVDDVDRLVGGLQRVRTVFKPTAAASTRAPGVRVA